MRFMWLGLLLLLHGGFLFASQRMYVAICDLAGVPGSVIHQSEAETTFAFTAAGVQVRWVGCSDVPKAKEDHGDQLFVVRLQDRIPVPGSRSVSLDALGRAYTNERGLGYVADAYIPSISLCAEQRGVGREILLGFVIAHELGHLLLGPGHVQDGIMYGTWRGRETRAMMKRWLVFDRDERAIIQEELAKRAPKPAFRN
jgi:hypothetical protein